MPGLWMAWKLNKNYSMKTTAITVWDGIISPVFDAADTFLLVNGEGARETVRLNAASPMEVTGALKAKNVGVVICGAISAVPLRMLAQSGMTVISWIRGDVERVIEAYRRGALRSPPFQMPGCGACGPMCGRRRRWQGGRFSRFVP
jgi:predicted Fe-Mo cluster-binding NifX family protein